MRTAFDRQLDALTTVVAETCALAGEAMQHATEALLQADLRLTGGVTVDQDRITLNAVRAEEKAVAPLALQAPVAGDLRVVVAALKNSADLWRMGALARHVANIVRRGHPARVLPDEATGYFAEMGRLAVDLSKNANSPCNPAIQSWPLGSAATTTPSTAYTASFRPADGPTMEARCRIHHRRHPAGPIYERFADHAVEGVESSSRREGRRRGCRFPGSSRRS
jgi:hypothetical protein